MFKGKLRVLNPLELEIAVLRKGGRLARRAGTGHISVNSSLIAEQCSLAIQAEHWSPSVG